MIVFDLLLFTFTQSYLPHFYYEKKIPQKLKEKVFKIMYINLF